MSGRPAPAKPWERKGPATTSSTTPLGPSTANDGAPKPWETTTPTSTAPAAAGPIVNRARPWEAAGGSGYGAGTSYGGVGNSSYGNYGSGSTYGGNYGSTMGGGYGASSYPGGMGVYGSTYGAGSSYGAGSYGSSMYGRPMGSTMGSYGGYGSGMGGGYGSSSYGGGMYGRPYGGYNSYGSGVGGGYMGAPYGAGALPGQPGAPFDAANPPPPPPSAWQSMLHAISGIVHFFGRLSFLVDENAHAVHFFIAALLQLLDRAGSLYGELARFILRILGYKSKAKPQQMPGMPGGPGGMLPGPMLPGAPAPALPPPEAPAFDSVWGS